MQGHFREKDYNTKFVYTEITAASSIMEDYYELIYDVLYLVRKHAWDFALEGAGQGPNMT